MADFNPSSDFISALRTGASSAYDKSSVKKKIDKKTNEIKRWAEDSADAAKDWAAGMFKPKKSAITCTEAPSSTEEPTDTSVADIPTQSGYWQADAGLSGNTGSLRLKNMGITGLSGSFSADYDISAKFFDGSGGLANVQTEFSNPKITLSYENKTSSGVSYSVKMGASGNLTYNINYDNYNYKGTSLMGDFGVNGNGWNANANGQIDWDANGDPSYNAGASYNNGNLNLSAGYQYGAGGQNLSVGAGGKGWKIEAALNEVRQAQQSMVSATISFKADLNSIFKY